MTSCLDKITCLVIIHSILERIKCVLGHSSGLHQGAKSVNALLSISVLRLQKSSKLEEVQPILSSSLIRN